MKRINEYKKLFSVENNIDLKTLKSTYRDLVKEWHPDKFQSDDVLASEAEIKSRQIIDGYHFLVSLAPETIEAKKEEFNTSTVTGIENYKHKGLYLEITFIDGSIYEFFGVPKSVYVKFSNSDKQLRFAKRNIFGVYQYRQATKTQVAV